MTSGTGTWLLSSLEKIPTPVRRGVLAVLPLFPGMIALDIAFAVSALAEGVSALEVLAMSMLIFAGSAQVAMVSMIGDGASSLTIIATAVLLNLRHILYGLSASRWFEGKSGRARALFAFVFTDELYAISLGARQRGDASTGFMLAAGWTLYGVFVLTISVGLFLGDRVPELDDLGLDVVFPLAFIALLVPLIRARKHLLAALGAAALTAVLAQLLPGGAVILVVTLSVAIGAALIETHWGKGAR